MFYKKTMGPFLKGLSQCATTEKVQLHLVGFASATGLNERLEDGERNYSRSATAAALSPKAEPCEGKKVEDETDHSNMFNLLIARTGRQRGRNVAEIVSTKDAFIIEAIPWCSYAAMGGEARFRRRQRPYQGLDEPARGGPPSGAPQLLTLTPTSGDVSA